MWYRAMHLQGRFCRVAILSFGGCVDPALGRAGDRLHVWVARTCMAHWCLIVQQALSPRCNLWLMLCIASCTSFDVKGYLHNRRFRRISAATTPPSRDTLSNETEEGTCSGERDDVG